MQKNQKPVSFHQLGGDSIQSYREIRPLVLDEPHSASQSEKLTVSIGQPTKHFVCEPARDLLDQLLDFHHNYILEFRLCIHDALEVLEELGTEIIERYIERTKRAVWSQSAFEG